MTARYDRVADDTVSTALDGWHERVNVRGERIALPIDGPLAEAAWMKDRISRAKQAYQTGTADCRWSRAARTRTHA